MSGMESRHHLEANFSNSALAVEAGEMRADGMVRLQRRAVKARKTTMIMAMSSWWLRNGANTNNKNNKEDLLIRKEAPASMPRIIYIVVKAARPIATRTTRKASRSTTMRRRMKNTIQRTETTSQRCSSSTRLDSISPIKLIKGPKRAVAGERMSPGTIDCPLANLTRMRSTTASLSRLCNRNIFSVPSNSITSVKVVKLKRLTIQIMMHQGLPIAKSY